MKIFSKYLRCKFTWRTYVGYVGEIVLRRVASLKIFQNRYFRLTMNCVRYAETSTENIFLVNQLIAKMKLNPVVCHFPVKK